MISSWQRCWSINFVSFAIGPLFRMWYLEDTITTPYIQHCVRFWMIVKLWIIFFILFICTKQKGPNELNWSRPVCYHQTQVQNHMLYHWANTAHTWITASMLWRRCIPQSNTLFCVAHEIFNLSNMGLLCGNNIKVTTLEIYKILTNLNWYFF